ncbi:MAG TPA: ribonucleoside triphosphate reductase [Bacteroidales bacterium]|jgi:ribonucleoside-triphosphate reductase|nr:ribonucleoside triphosphate reductase [Bacteroidales bacterium]MDI9534303.1 ribonucleoside triphosphate reductase [Bacteroidota bacterium]MBP7036715.1 ribonucleoside triphosphate reductase [Bacteroidales bacterium]MBP8710014.1 ribonucleoside triphosphate reductase [Bacteroidales bacterium]MZQ80058.1 ribonucleoside triphosphate reductase [Bacteroidales bacterium]
MNGRLYTIRQIIKRNGDLVEFNPQKIEHAIFRAMRATGVPDRKKAGELSAKVVEQLETEKVEIPTVEQVQDIVEGILFQSGDFRLVKAYILYRKQRELVRNTKDIFSNIEVVDDYLSLKDWRVKESANSSYSLQGLNQHISTVITSQYWLNKLYPENIAAMHRQGYFHIHDLGFLSVYCVGWDLRDLLVSGFRGVTGKTQTRPARHFRTALGQIVNFFYTMQGEAAGAQAFSNFDTLLAPFIRFDNLGYSQVKQSLQEFLYNMNIPTRVGFQTPFTNVTLDLVVPDFLKNEPVVYGGELHESVYGDYQHEINLFNKAFAELMSEGDATGTPFSFPIPTYNITKDFDWDNPDYKPIWEMTSKYGIPYFSNFVNSDLSPDDVRSMCCRLRLDKRELNRRGGGLFASNPLTGSVGVVTINLPKLGYEASSEQQLMQRLRNLMELAKSSLEIKRKTIESYTEKGLYPYSKYYLRDIRKRYNCFWKNHFSTIGIVGMNECCLNFLGVGIADPDGKAFAIRVLNYMRDVLVEFQEETGNIYNLEATPAESTAYRFARIDTMQYEDIITANHKDYLNGSKPYYTNSTHLPVNFSDDVFRVLNHQDELQTLYTGGTVLHIFTGEKAIPAASVRSIVKKIAGQFRLPYFTLSPTFSICPSHGYIHGEHFECPECGSACEVFSRIVGYLRPVSQWNDGKKKEFIDRKVFRFDNVAKKNSLYNRNENSDPVAVSAGDDGSKQPEGCA